tara:strand:+ start:997 stop:2034 length:1038 start_codon:yes stop_codon:yes gene_type:complete
MKLNLFIFSILIILFKTGNVLSDTAIFSVNNIELDENKTKNREIIANEAFKEGYIKLINRLLLKQDFVKVKNLSLNEIKKLISHYQIIDTKKQKKDKILVNVFFDKKNVHKFFYNNNILYSDIINTEVIFFPLSIIDNKKFIYSKNYFLENWNSEENGSLIQYSLPLESIENIREIEKYKDDLFELQISEFFKEYEIENKVFTIIEKNNKKAKIFLKTEISGKRLIKTLIVKDTFSTSKEFDNFIILEIKNVIEDLIKSQNLIDVRTPSFLNVKIIIKDGKNLISFNERLDKIDLINNFFVQQLNKDFALVKISYFGKIKKIIKKLQEQDMSLEKIKGEWLLKII